MLTLPYTPNPSIAPNQGPSSFSRTNTDPILYLGLDVATKRDTCALVAISPDDTFDTYYLWGYRVWNPPVDLVRQVEPVLDRLFTTQAVAGMWYDPFQAITLAQRLRSKGHGHRLVEVNQLTQMTQAANTLHSMLTEDRLTLTNDPEIRSYFSWTSAKNTERGWRIIKLVQNKKIDFVVALAMSILGASSESGIGTYPAWSSKLHVRSPFVLDNIAA